MEQICLDGSLTLSFPDGFRKLSEAELGQMRAIQSGPGVCLRNEEAHIVVSLGYRHAGLLSALLSAKDLIKSAENRIAGAMRAFNYRLTEYQTRSLGNKTAQCFQYAYEAQNTEMAGECCAVKAGKTIYYLHFYVRNECRDKGFRLWRNILAEARWA